ncbi:hypothetical protein CCHR01_04960 [Colletotrichum chrysophilum]|uniref:Uncharacterized protein n=1 Tax=Colletotrichum chrysophilum TaxID=1836956 RepID=A0AAD9ARZ5_9PEZI|nr:hypothetical protein CCHR01_04960 [Colletotrichum chrysophilum]
MMGGIRPHILISLFPRGGVYGGVSFPRQQACSPDTVADRVQGDARERLQTPPCHQTDSYNHSRAAQQRVVRPSIWILSRRNGRCLRDRRQNPEMGDHLVMGDGGSIRSQRENAHRVQHCSRVVGEPDVDKVRVSWDGFDANTSAPRHTLIVERDAKQKPIINASFDSSQPAVESPIDNEANGTFDSSSPHSASRWRQTAEDETGDHRSAAE